MSRPVPTPRRHTPYAALVAGALALTLASPVAASVAPASATPPSPATAASERPGTASAFALPDGFQPEGIATSAKFAYLGSRADGDIYRADVRTGKGRVIAQGPGTPSLGMKVDARGRLFVAGGSGGDARVIDVRTGEVLRSYRLVRGGEPFINDVVLTRSAAFFTDSTSAQLFRLPLPRDGRLPGRAQVERLVLRGEWQQAPDGELSANGITTSPDGRLLVVDSTSGKLYRVTRGDGRAAEVDLGGLRLTNGDGLLREGRLLYVVQNRLDRIAVLRLSADADRARPVRRITSPAFDVPTTIARSGRDLLLPNARFTTPPTPRTSYDAVSVRAPR